MRLFQSIDLYLKCVGGEMCAVIYKRFNEGFWGMENVKTSGPAGVSRTLYLNGKLFKVQNFLNQLKYNFRESEMKERKVISSHAI